ncbi:MAG: hypothetical protein FWC00_05690, partial [Firmicutes bacterium]|nr:hypothetical protein [Bacillota bacterium]
MKEPVKKLLSAVVLPLAVTGAVNVFTSCTQPNAPKPPVEDQRTPCPDGCGALLKPGEECPNCTITVVPPPKCSECGGKLIDGECINEDCMEYKGPGQPIDTREQLNAPTNLRLRSQGASFMWSHSPMNVAHSFRVYVDGYPTEFIIPNNGTGFSTALLGLAPGTTVTLNVR